MYLLTEWEGRYARSVCPHLEPNILPSGLDLIQSISILSYDHLLTKIWTSVGRDDITSDGRARAEQLHKSFYNKNCHSFLRVEQEIHNSSKKPPHFLIFVFQLQFMPKSQLKVDIKLYVKAIKKLASDKRSLHASLKLFTNLHLKTHEYVGAVPSYLSTSWTLLNKGQQATEY